MRKYPWLPTAVRSVLVSLRNRVRRVMLQQELKGALKYPIKRLVIGSSGTRFDGWIPTDQENLNLLLEDNWLSYFTPDAIDAILAEHVWEHLTPAQALIAASNCKKFLKPGGYLRVAVPDGCHPDASYIENVRPGGTGDGADDHKTLYTHLSFAEVFTSVGFEVSLLEYFDENGAFHQQDWDPSAGMIRRSSRWDSRNSDGKLRYTSIILDARKPSGLDKA